MTHEYLLQKYGVRVDFVQAGEILGLHWQTVREMCLRGEIKAVRAGRRWIVTTKAIADFLDNAAKPAEVIPMTTRTKHKRIV